MISFSGEKKAKNFDFLKRKKQGWLGVAKRLEHQFIYQTHFWRYNVFCWKNLT